MNVEITDTAIIAAADDMADDASTTGDHETATLAKEAAAETTAGTPGTAEVSGIMPETDAIDLSDVKIAAPAPTLVITTPTNITVGGVATAVAKGVAAGTAAKVIGDALPADLPWGWRLLATVTGGVIAATAVGAGIDAATGWFGKDTAA